MLNLIQKLTKLLNTEVTQFRQITIFQRFLYTKTLKMLSVYYRKALRLIYQDIAERNISFENKKECRKASECISTSVSAAPPNTANVNAARHQTAIFISLY